MTRSRIPGLAHTGIVGSDGAFAHCPVVTLCSATGEIVVQPDLVVAPGAEMRGNVVRRAWWRRMVAWLR
ncbi:MAG: hypothetical protein JWM87_691 [Candidatus Eremiobacteraeota bacterium]|nr:hypothetical protein [Candidatus Eremiobacteraeota bacterium]